MTSDPSYLIRHDCYTLLPVLRHQPIEGRRIMVTAFQCHNNDRLLCFDLELHPCELHKTLVIVSTSWTSIYLVHQLSIIAIAYRTIVFSL
jgi:hypothetical protein